MPTHKPLPASRIVAALCLLALLTAGSTEAGRTSSNLASVVTATCLGSEGTEWLTAGAFPGDDSIILAGISLDPELTLLGVKATVLGKDAPPLEPFTGFRRLADVSTGKIEPPKLEDNMPATDILEGDTDVSLSLVAGPTKQEILQREQEKAQALRSVPKRLHFYEDRGVEAQDVLVKLSWFDPQATGFIGRFDATLKKVRALYRFPRGSCGITSLAVSKQGDLYVAGYANERIRGACEDCRVETVDALGKPFDPGKTRRYAFLARFSPDLARVVWLRELRYKSFAPKLRMLNDGNICMLGPGYVIYQPDGTLVRANHIPWRREVGGTSVCPVTGRYVRIGDYLTGTGRQPMRVPRLLVYEPNGVKHKQLLTWSPGLFCPEFFHLCADAAVRYSAFDDEGNLIYSTWCHGGNNCTGRLPYDPEIHIPNAMGYTGFQTCCYVVKLDPEHNLLTGTLWTSAAGINRMIAACDGSIAWTGNTGEPNWLPNSLSNERGLYLVVADPNLVSYRFFSSMPACGTRVVVGGCDKALSWSLVSGRCEGRPMLLCLTGAVLKEGGTTGKGPPPEKNPVQAYGGGTMDGYALLLDLTARVPLARDLPGWKPRYPGIPQYVGNMDPRPPHPERDPSRPPLIWPKEGQVWMTGEDTVTTVVATLRDELHEKWPNYFGGRGVKGGSFTFGTNAASANFTLDLSNLQQTFGLQHQRVLGDLMKTHIVTNENGTLERALVGPEPAMKLHVTGMSPWIHIHKRYHHMALFGVGQCLISGTIEFMDRQVPFKDALCEASFSYPWKDSQHRYLTPDWSFMATWISVPGSELGLSAPLAERMINFTIRWEATSTAEKEVIEKEPPPTVIDDAVEIDVDF